MNKTIVSRSAPPPFEPFRTLPLILVLACGDSGNSGPAGTGAAGVGGATSSTGASPPSNSTAGGGGTTSIAACDAPPVSPSNGDCYDPLPAKCSGLGGMGAGGGEPLDCSAIVLVPGIPACEDCVKASCCEFLDACVNIVGCLECYNGQSNDCADAAIEQAIADLLLCDDCRCIEECPPFECNPVTGEPCDTNAGEACDRSLNGVYICFPPPNDVAPCGECSQETGVYCQPGYRCLSDNTCGKYCCGDEDCGSGICSFDQPEMFEGGVGVCVKAP